MSIYTTLIVLEMLAVNISITFVCSKKRKNIYFSILVLLVFTALVLLFSKTVLPNFSIHGNGNGNSAFVMIGLIYIIPFIYLFKQSILHTFAIMSTAWIYSMLVLGVSYRIGYIFSTDSPESYALISQTLLFALTLWAYLMFIEKKFIYILWNIDKRSLRILTLLGFSLLIIVNILLYIFVEGTTHFTSLLLLAVVILAAFSFYNLAYRLVTADISARNFHLKSRTDGLTGIKNRQALTEDHQEMISTGREGSMIFIDLDSLKTVNDRFGHLIGDKYIITFVEQMVACGIRKETIYRLSGDEFVILCDKSIDNVNTVREMIRGLDFTLQEGDLRFIGVSLGTASFPDESNVLKELLTIADERMYKEKMEKFRLSRTEARRSRI